MKRHHVAFGALLAGLIIGSPVTTQDPARHEHGQEASSRSPELTGIHGGAVTTTEEFRFEVVFHRDEILIHTRDAKGKPIDPRHATGTVRVDYRDAKRDPLEVELRYAKPAKNAEAVAVGHLRAAIDLREVGEGMAAATIRLAKLPGAAKTEVRLEQTFELARLIEYVCPMKCTAPLASAGKCPKCGMSLKAVRYLYVCPTHPEVTARDAGAKCWKCQMRLVKESESARSRGSGTDGGAHGNEGGHGHR
jgi:hypothetical protein